MKTFSSRQAAKRLGLPVSTLGTYLAAEKVPAPKSVTTGDITVYLWTEADIEHVRTLLPKIANGRKTRYQKQSKTPARAPAPHKKRKKKK